MIDEYLINHSEITQETLREGRWYVSLKDAHGRTCTVPKANYTWLKSNPSFLAIPKGYVIHHLDLDPLNDDSSNLVLMQKHQHTAYHLKHKTINHPVQIDGSHQIFFQGDPSKIHIYKGNRGKFYLQWWCDNNRNYVGTWNGKTLDTEEAAAIARDFMVKNGYLAK